mgnify:CR=1 FL=1
MKKRGLISLVLAVFSILLVSPVLAMDDIQVWQGQYYTGSSFNTGTYEFNFTVYDALTGGNSCYTNTTDLTTGTWGEWKTEQEDVSSSCNNVSKNYYLNINIDGTDQTPRRRLTMLNYLRNKNTITETSDGKVGIGTSNPLSLFHLFSEEDSASHEIAYFDWNSSTPADSDSMYINYRLANDAGALTEFFRQTIKAEQIGSGAENGSLLFEVLRNGTLEIVMKLNTEEIVFNEDGTDRNFRVEGATEENALFVDGSNGNIGLGTNNPQARIEALGLGASNPSADWFSSSTFGLATLNDQDKTATMAAYAGADSTERPLWFSKRARGTLASPTAVLDGDWLGSYIAAGHDGTGFQNGASINFEVDGTVLTGSVPTAISFETGGSWTDRTEKMRLDSSGRLGIGAINPNATLHVNDTLMLEPILTAPSSPEEGWIYFDSDLHKPCYYNSTDWVQFDGGGTCS